MTEKALFENAQWRVTSEYVECVNNGYWFELNRLDELRQGTNLPDWPLHLASKGTVDIPLFMDAFRFALDLHNPSAFTPEILDKVEMMAIRRRAEGDAYQVAFNRWQERHYPTDSPIKLLSVGQLDEFECIWNGRSKDRSAIQ